MEKKYSINDISFTIGSTAAQAILYEAAAFPSPGLVSPVSQGAHIDMDFYTFLDSSTALIKYLVLCAESGLSHRSESEIFNELRILGIDAEKKMFEITEGINTHKGMLFLLGICAAAVSKTLYLKREFFEIQSTIKKMTEGIIIRELEGIQRRDNSILSHGEKMYLLYNVKGIREEVENGLPTVFNYSLNLYEENCRLNKRERLVNTLIGIMQHCNDTTILYRHDKVVLEEVKKRAAEIIQLGGMMTCAGKNAIELLDKEFSRRGISPGGSADLLSVTVFMHEVKKRIFRES